jgi:putative ABC transport system permease protein
VAGGLLLKSFRGLMATNVGFDYRDLMAIRLHLPEERYGDPEAQLAFYRELQDRVGTGFAPSLRGSTVASGLVENLSAAMGPVVPEGEDEQEGPPSFLVVWEVGPEYFDVVGVPLVSGRGFDGSEERDGEAVVIINQTLADRYFQGRDPVGRLLKAGRSQYRVVGVAGSVNLPGFAGSSIGGLQLFLPFTQRPGSDFTLLARVRGDRASAVQRLKEAVWAVDGSVPVQDVSLIEDELSESLATERANALLMALFALTALALGAVGIYGVVAYSVNRRVREVGIRMAMGASSGEVVGKVVAGGMTRVVVGMIVGGAGALALGRTLSGLLVGVSPRDPAVFAVVFLVMGSVALLSTWLPARRAARVRPMEALRTD